jgi:hypothetical protein
VCLAATACGKKGPPLPPLLKQPQPPAEISAARHGDVVDIQFVVPAANTDGTRPANVARIDVYGITGPSAVTDEQILKLGTKVASVQVKTPRNPNETIEPGEPESEMQPPEGRGVDQGAVARVDERLTPEAAVAIDLTKAGKPGKTRTVPAPDTERPLLAPTFAAASRSYVGVSVSAKGKRSPMSARATVAMVDPPRTLPVPAVGYDETTVSVSWPPVGGAKPTPVPGEVPVLPSTPIGRAVPTFSYNVYAVSDATPPVFTLLTKTPVDEPSFSDPQIVWGEKRCYAVRAVETIEDLKVEGAESPAGCVTLVDTFPPKAPQGLQAVASEGAINLIWDANQEKDVRGYIVLRAIAPAETLEPVMSEPIRETSFKDAVKPGIRFIFAVRAVDAAGNMSPPSARVEETAR